MTLTCHAASHRSLFQDYLVRDVVDHGVLSMIAMGARQEACIWVQAGLEAGVKGMDATLIRAARWELRNYPVCSLCAGCTISSSILLRTPLLQMSILCCCWGGSILMSGSSGAGCQPPCRRRNEAAAAASFSGMAWSEYRRPTTLGGLVCR